MATRNEILLHNIACEIRDKVFDATDEGEQQFKDYMIQEIGFTESELNKVYPNITEYTPDSVLSLKELCDNHSPIAGTNVLFRLKDEPTYTHIGVFDYNNFYNKKWKDTNTGEEYESEAIARWSEYKL